MEVFYSQHGEDYLVNEIYKGKTDGCYVEVGCLDGIEFSNTYFFEKKGWKGVCVEAHNDFISALCKNRPNSKVVHCAVGEANKENVTFYANRVGSLSTLDRSEEERWKKNYAQDFHGFEEQQVSMRTLTSIFDELELGEINLISLDIEGYEVMALKGLDFNKYKPEIFIIEYKDEIHRSQIDEILFKHQYHFLSQIGCNLFYSLRLADKKIINADHGVIQLTKFDLNGVEQSHEIRLTRPSLVKKVIFKIRGWIKEILFNK